MESTNCRFVPFVNGRRVASTPEMAAEQTVRFAAVSAARCSSVPRTGRSSGGHSALMAAWNCDSLVETSFVAVFSDGQGSVKGDLNDSPIPWVMEAF